MERNYKIIVVALLVLAIAIPVSYAEEQIPLGSFTYTGNNPLVFTPLIIGGTPTTCLWDFGDGSTSTSCDGETHLFSATGTYTVLYHGENSLGFTTITSAITVSNVPTPINNRPSVVYPEEMRLPIPVETTIYATPHPTVAVTITPAISTEVPTTVPTTQTLLVQRTVVTTPPPQITIVPTTTEPTYPEPTPTPVVTEIIQTPDEPASWWDGIYQFFANVLSGFGGGN